MINLKPLHVLINLRELPMNGHLGIITRVTPEQAADIKIAARLLGIGQSQFQRMVLVQSARKIISEMAESS